MANGTGSRQCWSNGAAWGQCALVSCNRGYSNVGGVCQLNPFSWRTYQYGAGEAIYGGELYYPHIIFCRDEVTMESWNFDMVKCGTPEGYPTGHDRCWWSNHPNQSNNNLVHWCR